MKVIKFSSSVMVILDIVMTIWGSVVVFGAWASWTYEKTETENLHLEYVGLPQVIVVAVHLDLFMDKGDHPKTFLLKALFGQSTPSWLKVGR